MSKWQSLYIFYFSGTGNARVSSEWIAEEFTGSGIKSVVQQIDRLENIIFPSTEEKPLLGFAFPTHGFNSAPIMLKFIASFPSGIGKEVFLLNTRAGMKLWKFFLPGLSGVALILPAFLLRMKGYRCIGFRPVDMPSNWISLHPGLKKKVIDSIRIRCEAIVRKFAKKIIAGRKEYRGLYSLPADLLISPVSLGYFAAGRYFLSKTYIASYKCNNCGICIRECPTFSIKLVENRPYWKLTCESCMRCLNHCPRKAIEATHGMAVVFWLIIVAINTQILFVIIDTLQVPTYTFWWKLTETGIKIVVLIFSVSILYRIMHFVMGLKPVQYLVRFTSLTSLPFWRRYNVSKNSNEQSLTESKKLLN